MRRHLWYGTLFSLTLLPATPLLLAAQDTAKEPPPTITVSAVAQMKVSPDRATISISVQTKASTAAAAGADNSKKQNAVLTALRALGLPNDQLSTTNFNVSPNYRYIPNKDPELTGYTVTNTIVAEVHDINQVGKVIDAALTNGANLISSLDFYASNTDSARRNAIAQAIQKARAEATVAAQAAGGSLGSLVDLSLNAEQPMPTPAPRVMMYAKGAADAAETTPINPGPQTSNVSVYTRWRFIQSR